MKKPTVSRLLELTQEFHNRQRRAIRPGNRSMVKDLEAARRDFKLSMEQIGLAEHLDWEEED